MVSKAAASQDDFGTGIELTDLPGRSDAVHSRHRDVHEDKGYGGALFLVNLKRLHAIACLDHLEPQCRKDS